ncbi:MAG: flavodoxin domain-containing protein [Lachnospiraceae bacterium]|nr:flavodoxin domain-containing protein [Lachnospiraceae bacterium]
MKGIILYQSKYGATKKYAEWLKEATNYECLETKNVTVQAAAQFDIIILAGGIYASGISGLSFLRKHIHELSNKKIAVLCVGASPFDEDAFNQIYAHNFKGSLQGITCFYGRGAWNESAMSIKDRTLCKMLQKVVSKKDPATYEPWEKALMCAVGQACDWTEKRYLQPLLEWIEAAQ